MLDVAKNSPRRLPPQERHVGVSIIDRGGLVRSDLKSFKAEHGLGDHNAFQQP